MALNRRVSLNNPEEDAIRRRQQLADALTKQSTDPIQIQSYQGIQAPIPVTEGLNKVLAGALGGYEDKRATQEGEDLRTRRKDEAAKYVKALDGWTNPDATGAPGNEVPGGQLPLSGPDRKSLLLQGLTSDNERVQGAAGTLYSSDQQQAQQERTIKAQQDAAAAAQQNQIALRAIPQAQSPSPGDSPEAFDQKKQLAQLKIQSDEKIAADRVNAEGKYYAVPTGSGIMILDKGTGMAQMMGQDDKGNLVPKGAPFKPMMGQGGAQLPASVPQPGAQPSTTPPQPIGGAPQPPVQSVMPPSLAVQPNYDVSRAKAEGTGAGQTTVGLNNAATSADKTLSTLQGIDQPRVGPKGEKLPSLLENSTSSTLGALRDAGGNFIGSSNTHADDRASLEVIQGQLLTETPKFSGPTSDADVNTYRTMVGRLSEAIPVSQKRSALKTIMELKEKARMQGTSAIPQQGGTAAPAPTGGEFNYVPGKGVVPVTQ